MRILLLVIGVVFFSAWHSHSEAGPSFSEVVPAPVAEGIDYRNAIGDHPTSLALARAIDARLIVRESRQGQPIHVQHCRVADGGCRARIAALSRLITEASNRAGVDPFLTAGIALRESGLNPLAVSPVGARGVVQLNPKYRGKTVPFVYNERYREECARRPGACQREVLEAGLGLYEWAGYALRRRRRKGPCLVQFRPLRQTERLRFVGPQGTPPAPRSRQTGRPGPPGRFRQLSARFLGRR